jgi:hypothetical protein
MELLWVRYQSQMSFYASTFSNAIVVNSYQDSTHRENSGGTEQCISVHIHNLKYTDSTHYSLDGGASTLLASGSPTTAQCTLKVNFSHTSSVVTSGAKIWAFDGTTDTNAPINVNVQAFQQGNTIWTNCNGRAAALLLADQAANASHDFFIGVSVLVVLCGLGFILRIIV